MIWGDPAVPNLADYTSFLASVVGIPPTTPPGAPVVFPTVNSTATGGTTTSLVDASQTWTANQWNGCTLYDSTQDLCALITGTAGGNQVTFAALTEAPAAGDSYIIVQPIVPISLGVAMRTVNCALNAVDPAGYTLAVYNLAADRLINFAPDQPGQTFFRDIRKELKISSFAPGVVSSTSDNGTATTLLNPEFMERLTLRDLQNLRTPYGRAYMEMAMDYGPNIWSLV